MKKIISSILVTTILLLALELWLRHYLFDYVSYSNSEVIDKQLLDRDKRSDWGILFVGDSETRWGINPKIIENTFAKKGMDVKVFNHAFDGFGISWWKRILPRFLDHPSLGSVKVVVVGVQLIDGHRDIVVMNDCGSLQKPVLTSAMAIDLGLNNLCKTHEWDGLLGRKIFNFLWTVKYASNLRTLILPNFMIDEKRIKFNSRKSSDSINGFQPHLKISDDIDTYEAEFQHWKSQYNPEIDFRPLDKDIYPRLIADHGFFDQINEELKKCRLTLVLYALPTNPTVIDTFNRRKDYLRNSKLMNQWAEKNKIIFIDLGIRDVDSPEDYFSDMRHLSGFGANVYSEEFAELLTSKINKHRLFDNY